MNSSAGVAASSAPKRKTIIASAPAAANSRWRWSRLVSRKGGVSGRKKRTGWGSKVATSTGRPFGAGALDRAADHRLVPVVKSIEIAERDDAPAKRLRNRRAAVQPLHAARYRRGGGGR